MLQPFYPFNTTISSGSIYVNSINGNPGTVAIAILSKGATVFSTAKTLSTGWNTFTVNKGDLMSNNLHTLSVIGTMSSTIDNYLIGTSSVQTYFYGSINSSNVMSFGLSTPDFMYKVYPNTITNLDRYPIVICDIDSRPDIVDKYLSGDYVWENVNLKIECYSRYPSEIDRICKGAERGMLRNRDKFPDVKWVTPGQLDGLSFISNDIFFRSIEWTVKLLVSKE
jgi:hypothetical protein